MAARCAQGATARRTTHYGRRVRLAKPLCRGRGTALRLLAACHTHRAGPAGGDDRWQPRLSRTPRGPRTTAQNTQHIRARHHALHPAGRARLRLLPAPPCRARHRPGSLCVYGCALSAQCRLPHGHDSRARVALCVWRAAQAPAPVRVQGSAHRSGRPLLCRRRRGVPERPLRAPRGGRTRLCQRRRGGQQCELHRLRAHT